MKAVSKSKLWGRSRSLLGVILAGLLFAGCKGTPTQSESAARRDVAAVAGDYRPQGQRPPLPQLSANSTLADFLRYAMLNQPQIEAAYFNWLSSVERITQGRSLPDPRLTFQTDIANVITSVMPGLMQELPGPGKLGLRAEVASAESQAKYFGFETSVLQSAFAFKRAYYQLHFLSDKVRVNREILGLLADLEKIARVQNEVGKVTLQDVLRAQIEQDRLATEVANLEDSRNPLLAQFKAALGLMANQPDLPMPSRFESTPLDLTSDQLLAAAFARNPRLKAMEAEVRQADAALRLAYKARVPDFDVGVEADAKAAPVMVRPQFAMTLPIRRDKIAAIIAEAQAGKRSAEARLSAEQIQLAVEFADKSFMYREATRNLKLLTDSLLPKARQALDVARSGYSAGKVDFINLQEAERSLLEFELAAVDARTRRELVLAEVSLLIIGVPPPGAPILTTTSQPSPAATLPTEKK